MPLAAGSATIAAQPAQAPVVPARGLAAEYRMDVETRNLLKHSEDFAHPDGWVMANGASYDPATNRLTFGTLSYSRIQTTSAVLREGVTYTFRLEMAEDAAPEGLRFSVRDSGGTMQTFEDIVVSGARAWYEFTFTAQAGATQLRLDNFDMNAGASVLIYRAQLYEGVTPLPYTPTSNKRAVYDYSGNGNHAHLGSAGTAFINPVGGPKALNLPGVDGNYATTPDSAALDITGSLDLRAKISLTKQTSFDYILSKRGASANSYNLRLKADWRLEFVFSQDGTTGKFIGSATALNTLYAEGTTIWVRATYQAPEGYVRFYHSLDGITWTQDGAYVTTTTSGLFSSSEPLAVGAQSSGGTMPFVGRIYRAQVFDGIDGTLVADFNAEDAPGDVSSFVSSTTGEVWTINQSAATTNDPAWSGGGVVFDGVDDHLTLPAGVVDGVVEVGGALLPLALAGVDITTPGGTTGTIRAATLYTAAQANAEKWQTINTIIRNRERAGGNLPTTLVRAGLVAEYRFDEGSGSVLTDHSGNGHHITINFNGGSVWVPEGLRGNASARPLALPYTPALATPEVTVLACVRHNAPADTAEPVVIFRSEVEGVTAGWNLYYREPPLNRWEWWTSKVDGGWNTPVTKSPATTGEWVLLGGTVNAAEIAGYHNGARTVTVANPPYNPAVATGTPLDIIRYHDTTAAAVLIYDRALSDAEVAHNYEALKRSLAARGVTLP